MDIKLLKYDKIKKNMNKIILIVFLLFSSNAIANKGSVTGFDIPRFVSLKSNDVNLRIGPSINYPIEIKYIQKNLPIEIIDEFDVWRKVKDFENNVGWVHKKLIKGDRYIITLNKKKTNVDVYNRPRGKILGIVEKNNILKLEKCIKEWCYFDHNQISGWISKKNIWGVYEEEIFNLPLYQTLIDYYWKILDSNFFNK